MRKYSLLIIFGILALVFSLIAAANFFIGKNQISQKQKGGDIIQKIGTLRLVGNEPFTNLILETDNKEIYCIIGSLKSQLQNHYQYRRVIVEGNLASKEACVGAEKSKGGSLNVLSFKAE